MTKGIRQNLTKTGIVCLALGIGFAFWTGMLSIGSTVEAGDSGVEFSNQMSNDSTASDLSTGDPAEWGSWTHPDLDTPSGWTWAGNVQPGAKEVASIDCAISAEKLMTATITNGYPGYVGGTAFTLHNTGTDQVKIESVKLVQVSKGGATTGSPNLAMVVCTTYYVDADTGNVDTTLDAGDDFSLHLGVGLAVGTPIEAGDTVFGDIGVRVEQGAKELASYDFTIEIYLD
ncbi:hypothetical protein ES703_62507 [subsurface metagenome]